MAYASVADMVSRFGQVEMIHLSVEEGQPMEAVDEARVGRALADASALIDTYLRSRYAVPLPIAPAEIKSCCCVLARYDMSFGGGRDVAEQTRLAQKQRIDWLAEIAKGVLKLDLEELSPGDDSYAQVSVRGHAFPAVPAWEV